MAEKKGRTGRQLGLFVPTETAERLKALSAKTDIPQSRLLRQGLQLLFEKYAEILEPKSGKPRSGRKN